MAENIAQYDLHLHTHWSYDAMALVEDYFKLAREKKLRAFSITDHHTMDAYGDVAECIRKYPDVPFIPGAELTVHSPAGTFDMVCLGMPMEETPELAEVFETYRQWQRDYGASISNNLVRLGFDFDHQERLDVLKSYRPKHIIEKQGNTHVRAGTLLQAVIDRGFVKDAEGWKQLRAKFVDTPHYPEYDYVLPRVRRAGGLIFIAHPYGYFRRFDTARIDELRELLGFDGIECGHPDVPQEAADFYREYCVKHRLLSTGGSDCHQISTTEPGHFAFACHSGKPEWLDEILERLSK